MQNERDADDDDDDDGGAAKLAVAKQRQRHSTGDNEKTQTVAAFGSRVQVLHMHA